MRKTLFGVVSLLCVVGFVGCQTLGFGSGPGTAVDKDRQQVALEGAAFVALPAYFDMDHSVGTHSDHIKAALDIADDFIAKVYPEYISFSNLLGMRISDISGGAWNPQVAALYYILFEVLDIVLDDDEEAKAIDAVAIGWIGTNT